MPLRAVAKGFTTGERRTVRYAPRLMLIYRGNVAAKSNPPDSAFPGTLIPNCETTRAAPARKAAARGLEPSVLMTALGKSGRLQSALP